MTHRSLARPVQVSLIIRSAHSSSVGVQWPVGEIRPSMRRRLATSGNYTAIVQQDGEWWIGWIEEVPGVNSQALTREELLENLRDGLEEALAMNRADARAAATGVFEEVSIST